MTDTGCGVMLVFGCRALLGHLLDVSMNGDALLQLIRQRLLLPPLASPEPLFVAGKKIRC
jgi:hypothetical protein